MLRDAPAATEWARSAAKSGSDTYHSALRQLTTRASLWVLSSRVT